MTEASSAVRSGVENAVSLFLFLIPIQSDGSGRCEDLLLFGDEFNSLLKLFASH